MGFVFGSGQLVGNAGDPDIDAFDGFWHGYLLQSQVIGAQAPNEQGLRDRLDKINRNLVQYNSDRYRRQQKRDL